MNFSSVKVSYIEETPPKVDATYSNGFSASGTLNTQASVNSGLNGQSSGSVNSQSNIQTYVETGTQPAHVHSLKKRIHHRHRLWPTHSKVSVSMQTSKSLSYMF